MHSLLRLCEKYFISVVSVSIINMPGGQIIVYICIYTAASEKPFQKESIVRLSSLLRHEQEHRNLKTGDVWII